jgi:hypothetical protein
MEDKDLENIIAELQSSKEPVSYDDFMTNFDAIEESNPFDVENEFFSDQKDSRFLTPYDSIFEDNTDKLSSRQPTGLKGLAGLGRIGSKALSEIAKMPGVAIGAVQGLAEEIADAEGNDFMKTAFNNGWIKAINQLNEDVNEELLPVYVSKAVRDGDIWDNISSMDFWATEGADGLGFIASMLVPGAVINKLGLGAKALSGTTKLAKMANKTDEAVSFLNRIGLTPKNADLHMSTLANTIFEAGAEAGYAMDSYEEELKAQLDAGQISQEDFAKKMSKSAEIGKNIFLSNAAILVGPNAIMSKMLWGKTKGRTPSSLVDDSGKITKLENLTTKQKIGDTAKRFASGVGREGFFEEGMQSTVENYFTENPDSSLSNLVGDLASSYYEMLNSTEGQKAILLGALFGGGMSATMGYNAKDKNITNTNELIENANDILSDFYTVFNEDTFQRTPTGRIKYSKGQPVIDSQKVLEKMKGLQSMEGISEVYEKALEEGNTEVLDKIQDIVTTNLIKPFIVNDEVGIDVLKASLEEQRKSVPDVEDAFINDIISKAETLKNSYNTFKEFSNSLIKLKNKKATDQERIDFYNKLVNKYIDLNANKQYLKNKINSDINLRQEILREKDLPTELVTDDEVLIKEESKDKRLKQLNDRIRTYETYLSNLQKNIDEVWNSDKHNKDFNKYIAQREELETKQKKAEALDSLFEKLNNAKTVEELDSITNEDPDIKDAFDVKKAETRNKLLKEQKQKDQQTKETSEAQADESDILSQKEIDNISKNYNIGETVTLSEGPMKGQPLTIKKKNATSITLENEKGSTISIPYDKLPAPTVDMMYSTEGSNDLSVPFKENVTVKDEKLEERYDVKVISTDSNNNYQPLSFVDQGVVDFERTPVKKIGNKVSFEINNKEGLSDNQTEALNKLNNKDFSDPEFLYNHLPINVKLNDSVKAPIATLSENSDNYNNIFNKGSKILRKRIIDQLIKGVAISDISSEIIGQKNGQIQLEETVVENSIKGLYEFNGDIKKIKTNNIYVVDENGALRNNNDEIMPASRALAPGEIYLKIHTANGSEFPLKLNVKKINQSQAEVLYELYKYRFQNISEGKSVRIKDTTPELFELVKNNLQKEIEWFEANKRKVDDLTIKDIIDFLIWDNNKKITAKVKFTKGKLRFGKKSYTQEEFNTEEIKQEVISFLTNQKRHHIRYKKRGSENNNSPHFSNRSYVEYLINNEILNTNAKVNEPTFAGDTSIYLSKDKVKVKGKLIEEAKNIFDGAKSALSPKVTGEEFEKNPKDPVDLEALGFSDKGNNPVSEFEKNPEGGVDLSLLNYEKPSTTKQTSNKRIANGYKFLTVDDMKNIHKQIKEKNYLISKSTPIGVGKNKYFITSGTYYVIDMTNNKIVENLNTVLKVVDAINKVYKEGGINRKEVEDVWKARIESVNTTVKKQPIKKQSAKKQNEDIINVDRLSDKQIDVVRVQLSIAYKQYIKPLQLIGNKKISAKEKLKETIEFLENKNISKDDIKIKCGL